MWFGPVTRAAFESNTQSPTFGFSIVLLSAFVHVEGGLESWCPSVCVEPASCGFTVSSQLPTLGLHRIS